MHPVLIICPTSVVANWLSELAKFASELDVMDYTGPSRQKYAKLFKKVDVVLTTYGTLLQTNDRKILTDFKWRGVFLDEAHRIKNAKAGTTLIVKSLKRNYQICITGTPIENNLTELWSLFDFLVPDMLGERSEFDKYTQVPAESGNAEVGAALRKQVAPYILRRLKADVRSDLPPKIESFIYVQLQGKQAVLYETLRLLALERFREEVDRSGFPMAKNKLLTIFHAQLNEVRSR